MPVMPSSPSSFLWCDLDFGESDCSDKNRLEADEEGATGSQEASRPQGGPIVASECYVVYLCAMLESGSCLGARYRQVQAGLCGLVSSHEGPKGIWRDRHTYVHKHAHLITHRHASMLTQPLA